MTHASLFSGIGGADIAATWVGWTNLFHCEINPFGRKVLEYWYPNSTSYEDITKTDFTTWRGRIDVLTGGFPCQGFSLAGKRLGDKDHRYLWPQMLRAIREIQPRWVVGENVAGILTMVQSGSEVAVGSEAALFGTSDRERVLLRQRYTVEEICESLEREGYAVQPFLIPACAVGAPHRRDRVWFVARRVAPNTTGHGDSGRPGELCTQDGRPQERVYAQSLQYGGVPSEPASHPDEHRGTPRAAGEGTQRSRKNQLPLTGERRIGSQRADGLHGLPRDAAHTDQQRRKELHHSQEPNETLATPRSNWEELPALRWADFPTQSPVRGRDDGLSSRLAGITFPRWRAESIKALGNAWVPQVAYEIFRAIQQTEDEETTTRKANP